MSIKIAVMSDIHGNRWALEAVIEDIRKRNVDHIVNLGDCLYGPLDPAGTARILMSESIISIAGNQDRNIIQSLNKESPHYTMEYVINCLDEGMIDWLKSLTSTYILSDDFFLCHGTPSKDNEYLIESITEQGTITKQSNALVDELSDIRQKIVLCGHSHLGNTAYLPDGKIIINPGSVGLQAYDDELPYYHAMESGSPDAKYCIVSLLSEELRVERVNVVYDFMKASEYALNNNRPDWAGWIRTGKCSI